MAQNMDLIVLCNHARLYRFKEKSKNLILTLKRDFSSLGFISFLIIICLHLRKKFETNVRAVTDTLTNRYTYREASLLGSPLLGSINLHEVYPIHLYYTCIHGKPQKIDPLFSFERPYISRYVRIFPFY